MTTNEMIADVGIVRLGVMARNLALNLADHGYRVAVYNRTTATTERFVAAAREAYGWPLDLAAIAAIWRGGCIIRARLLHQITNAVSCGARPREPDHRSRCGGSARRESGRLA